MYCGNGEKFGSNSMHYADYRREQMYGGTASNERRSYRQDATFQFPRHKDSSREYQTSKRWQQESFTMPPKSNFRRPRKRLPYGKIARKVTKANDDENDKMNYDNIPTEYFSCHICNLKFNDSQSFSTHVNGATHDETLLHLDNQDNEETLKLRNLYKVKLEEEIANFEARGLIVNRESRCVMCATDVPGTMTMHRKSPFHTALRDFLHPECKVCGKRSKSRKEWKQHYFLPPHLSLVSSKKLPCDTFDKGTTEEITESLNSGVVIELEDYILKDVEEADPDKTTEDEENRSSGEEEAGNNPYVGSIMPKGRAGREKRRAKKDDLVQHVGTFKVNQSRNISGKGKWNRRIDSRPSRSLSDDEEEGGDFDQQQIDSCRIKRSLSEDVVSCEVGDDFHGVEGVESSGYCERVKLELADNIVSVKEEVKESNALPPQDESEASDAKFTVDDEGFQVPVYTEDREWGRALLKDVSGCICRGCKRFFDSAHLASEHCRTKAHFDRYIYLMKQKILFENSKASALGSTQKRKLSPPKGAGDQKRSKDV